MEYNAPQRGSTRAVCSYPYCNAVSLHTPTHLPLYRSLAADSKQPITASDYLHSTL